jgi:hypothetical protein
MAWLPAAASAQSGNISIISAGLDSSGDPYDLTVVANDGNGVQIGAMTAHVFDSGDNDVADPVMTYSSGPDDAQVWVPVTPIAQSALPPGTYTVTVDASDSTGENDPGLAAPGSFSFSYTTTLTVTPNPTTVTQGSQNVAFSGTLTGVAPGGTPVGISGAPVSVSVSGGSPTSAGSTDSGGDFNDTIDGITQSADYNFSVPGTGTYATASDDVTVNAEQATTAMTVTPSPPSVTQGSQNVTFNGTVTVTPQGSTTAVGIGSGVPVYLSVNGGTATPVTTTDDASGDFSYPVTGITQSTDYNFSVVATNLYSAASYDVPVNTAQATSAITVAANPTTVTVGSQSVTFTGTITVTPPGTTTAVGIGNGIPVDLSIGGGTPIPVTSTDDASGDFTYTVDNIDTSTDYNFSVTPTNLYGAASFDVPVGLTQAPTTVKVAASPQDVTFGSQSVTFTGTVTALPPGSTAAAGVGSGVPVFLSIGGATPSPVTTTSDAAGDFTYTVDNITTGTDYNFSVGATGLYTAASNDVPVNIDPATTNMTVTATPTDVNLGSSTVMFTGTVSVTPPGGTAVGIGSGVPVLLNTGGGATEVTTTDDANGDFSYTATGITMAADYDFSVAAASLYTAGSDTVPIGLDQLNTNLVVTPNHMDVTEGSQSITFSGTLTGTQPGSTTPIDIPGNVAVDLSVNGGTATQVAQTSSSQFSYTVTGISNVTSYDFSVASSPTYTAGTADVSIGLSPAQTRITALSISPAHLKYGQKATLKGTVQYLSGKTWTDLPSPVVHLAEGKTSLGTVRAGTNGSFTASLPTTHGSSWSAIVPSGNLIQQASATGNLSIAVPTKLKSFAAKLTVNGNLNASGCIEVTVPVSYSPLSKIDIQYATRSRGPWKSLGELQLRDIDGPSSACGAANESSFSGSIHTKLANGYYRADFPASFSFQSSVSGAIHAWRYQTKITGFSVGPHSVKTGQTVTITGRLWRKVKNSWAPYAGRTIEYIYNDKGTKFWGKLGTSKTNSHGYFRQLAAGGAGTFVTIIYAEYGGSSTDFAVRSSGVDISVNPKKSTAAASTSSGSGSGSAGQLPVILSPPFLDLAMAGQAIQTATSQIARQF